MPSDRLTRSRLVVSVPQCTLLLMISNLERVCRWVSLYMPVKFAEQRSTPGAESKRWSCNVHAHLPLNP